MNIEPFSEFKRSRFKICRKCKVEKHVSKFTWSHLHKGREVSVCYDCALERMYVGNAKGAGKPNASVPSKCWWYYDLIIEMAKAGKTKPQIVAAIGDPEVDYSRLGNFCARQRITTGNGWQKRDPHTVRKVSEDTLDQVRLRIHRGESVREIGRAIGVTRNTIIGWCHRYRLRHLRERPESFFDR